MLDDFESEAYERKLQTVVTSNGLELTAFVYVLNQTDLQQLALEQPDLNLDKAF